MGFLNSLSVVTFTALFCIVKGFNNDNDIDPYKDDVVALTKMMYKIIVGVYLGLAILYGIIFLLCYKRCCGPRVKYAGMVVSQNTGIESGSQNPGYQAGSPYPPSNVAVYFQPSHDQSQEQKVSQQYVPPQQFEQYTAPPPYGPPQQQTY